MEATVNGVTLSYDVHGDGEPVLLIPGGGQPAATWDQNLLPWLLEDGYCVVTYDLRGVAPSACPPGDYAFGDMVTDCIGLIEELSLARVHLIGVSAGGWIGGQVARSRPDLARSLTAICGIGRASAYERAALQTMKELGEAGVVLPAGYAALDFMRDSFSPTTLQDDDVFAVVYGAVSDTTLSPPSREQLAAWIDWTTTDEKGLHEIRCPTLLVAFEHDLMVSPTLCAEAAAEIPTSTMVVVPSAGHLGLFERGEDVRAAISEFMTTLSAD